MKRDEYLKMLLQDVEGEKEPEKELYEAVLECAAEARIREESQRQNVCHRSAPQKLLRKNLERIMFGRSISFVLYSEMLRRLRCIVWRI